MWKSGPSRAGPGQAEPSQAGPGRRLGPAPGQLLELASFRKTIDSCTRNTHFRAAPPKPIISSTRNAHFQNSIPTPVGDDPRPASPTAVSKNRVKIYVRGSAAECVFLHAPNKKLVLTKRNKCGSQSFRYDFVRLSLPTRAPRRLPSTLLAVAASRHKATATATATEPHRRRI